MPTERTYTFTLTEMGDAAENVRDVLTSALHGRDTRDIHLLNGSKSDIRQAIYEAIIDGIESCRVVRDERKANGDAPIPSYNSVREISPKKHR